MKHEAVNHPKMQDLAEALGLPLYAPHGILEMLWHHAGDYTPLGDIGKLSDQKIARACGWKDDPQVLIDALVGTGWLDRNERYRLIIHDWPDHAQDWIRKKLRRLQKKRAHEQIDWLEVYENTSDNNGSLDQSVSSHDQTDFHLGADNVGNSYRPVSVQSLSRLTHRVKGGLGRLGLGGVGDSEIHKNGHSAPSPLDVAAACDELEAIYPPKGRSGLIDAQRWYVEKLQTAPDPAAYHANVMERMRRFWVPSKKWHEGYVKNFDEFVRNERWREEPEPANQAAPSPHETPEQMRAREQATEAAEEAARAERLEQKRAKKENHA